MGGKKRTTTANEAAQEQLAVAAGEEDTVSLEAKAWPFMICYLLFPIAYLDFYEYLPGSPLFGPFFVFLLIPLVDVMLGLDNFNPPANVYVALEKRFSFRIVTLLWLPAQTAFLLWACYVALPMTAGSSARWWGLLFNVGVNAGLSINMAHELIHKQPWYEHWSGALCLCLSCYPHFTVEHIKGHHVKVSTYADPASSRLNEWVYTFYFRSIIGGFVSAFHEDFLKSSFLWACTIAFSLLAIPRSALSFFYLQGLLGIIYLETVNYLEHYGLTRRPSEPVNPLHSWNAGHRTTNYFLLKLQRHSDHHAYAGRRYQSLRSWPYSPQLPQGYATMILTALVPPLWFHIMNPRVAHAQAIMKQLKEEGRIEDVFTDEYLAKNGNDANLPHWD